MSEAAKDMLLIGGSVVFTSLAIAGFTASERTAEADVNIVTVKCPEGSVPTAELLVSPARMALFGCMNGAEFRGITSEATSVEISSFSGVDPRNLYDGAYIVTNVKGEDLHQSSTTVVFNVDKIYGMIQPSIEGTTNN